MLAAKGALIPAHKLGGLFGDGAHLGGAALRPFGSTKLHSVVRSSSTYGVLKLTLRAGSYDWAFVPVAGGTFTDSGSGTCH